MKTQPEPIPPGEKVPPLLGSFLAERRDHITRRWIEAVRRNHTLESAKQVNDKELADHLPKLFDDLAAALGGKPVANEAKNDAEAHGERRWRQHYELEEVLEELGIVSRILLAHGLDVFVDAHPDTPEEQRRGARERILRFFEDTAAGSVRQYVSRVKRQMGDLHEKMRETDLSLSEQRRLALDSAKMGWWNYDVPSGVVSCDERFRILYDVEKEDNVYALYLSRVHPEDQPLVDESVKAALRVHDPAPYALDYRVRHRDGTVRWVAARGQAVFVGEGTERKAIRLAGTLADITEERQVAQTLAASEAKYRSLFDSIDQGYCTIELLYDQEGKPFDYRFLAANPAFARITGIADSVGRTVREFAPQQEEFWFETYDRVVRTGEPIRFEHEAAAFGGIFDVYAFRTAPPEARCVAVIFQNITERKRADAALQTALRETELARTEAEAANAAKDQFLAVLSHELRTPLTPVMMATHMLARTPDLPSTAQMALETIQRNVELEAQFIDDLLDLTRIARGKLEITREPLDLHEAVRRAVEVTAADLEGKHQPITVGLESTDHQVRGDATRLQQVFWNLLKNASKFTPKGGAICVTSRNEPDRVVVEVADTGIGFDAEAATRIFDAFAQANVEVTRRFGGLGLGLAISKATVDAHEGTLGARSDGLNQGATFTVSLPLWGSPPNGG